MTFNCLGENFRIVTFGESHGTALGVVIDGVKPGLPIDESELQAQLDRRRPGVGPAASPRREPDRLEILSGVFEAHTTGAPIALLIRNRDHRSSDYDKLREVFRPGHADYALWQKYGIIDHRGGGRSSGRETVARVAAGALARQLLNAEGVEILGHVVALGPVTAGVCPTTTAQVEREPLRCADPVAAEEMRKVIANAKDAGDSVGGIVEVIARSVPAGLGDPVFGKLDARLAAALMSIGAVKAVAIGDGFELAKMRGSEANDPITPEGFATNRCGGILGGVSTGADIVARIAVKPTPSIRLPQDTIDRQGKARRIQIHGRHDTCICPRIVPVAEAMVAVVLLDALLRQKALRSAPPQPEEWVAELAFCETEIIRTITRRNQLCAMLADLDPNDGTLKGFHQRLAELLELDESSMTKLMVLVDEICAVLSSPSCGERLDATAMKLTIKQ